MPDGGSDCCGTCVFNRQWGTYHDPELEGRRERFSDCALRGVRTADPFWTYCEWWEGGYSRSDVEAVIQARAHPWRLQPEEIQPFVERALAYLSAVGGSFGPVYASGLYEDGYARIPWDGPNEPTGSGPAIDGCHSCQRRAEHSVQISPKDIGETLAFCSNACYMAWWRGRHPEPQVRRYPRW